ncbi:MAG: ATP-binding cassette domain-containing protein [Saprospiraceae bacterium]|nr:ATP-binding cassette domain-containing protein [Saprospiraceae bacterium]
MSELAIELKNINKTYSVLDKNSQNLRSKIISMITHTNKREIKALSDINLEIKKGEFFGIMGHNGSGKSTLLRIMAGAYPPDKGGLVKMHGRYMLLSLGLGFNPQLTARENIYLNASVLGLTLKQIGLIFREIVTFAELEKFVDTQVKYFSTGMAARLKFAIAVHADSDIFLMDEFFGGVGDEGFKQKSVAVFHKSLIEGRTIVHVSHSVKTIEEHCHRVLLLHQGKMIGIGTPSEVIPEYKRLSKNRKK